MHSLFFDQSNNFQWASVAAIISFLALISTVVSIYLSNIQGFKNRKSSTLVNLRIEELKEIRRLSGEIVHTINEIMSANLDDGWDIIHSEKLNLHINNLEKKYYKNGDLLFSILYRNNKHGIELENEFYNLTERLLEAETTDDVADAVTNFEQAIKLYSKIEYEEIEKYI